MNTLITLVFGILLAWSTVPLANNYPNKPVKIIVSLPAGSGPDVQVRRLAELLSAKWKQTVVVENRPGGAGLVAMNQLVSERADGYVIALFDKGNIISSPILHANTKAFNDIDVLAPFFTADMAWFVSPNIKNLAELKQLLQVNPSYGSWAIGSVHHIVGAEVAGILVNNATHVPYRDGALYVDVNSGALGFGFTSFGSGNAMYSAGRIRYLAVAAEQRHKEFPQVPTVKELTGRSIVAQSWLAFYIKKGVPAPIQNQLEKDLRDAIADPRTVSFLNDNYFIPLNNITASQFSKQVEQERVVYKNNLKRFNISLDQ